MARPHAITIVIGTAVLASTAALLAWCSRETGGLFAYALDDTYIHLELAWQLATTGTWGINPGEPASASSSPLWSLLLAAAMAATGHRAVVAAVLASGCGVAAVAAADRLLRDDGASTGHGALIVAAMVLLTPVPVMAAIGMEHTLQLALALAAAHQATRSLDATTRAPSASGLVFLGMLCATRYEGAFLGAAWGLHLLAARRWRDAAAVAAATAAPIVAFGLASTALGNAPVPNGLLMKSAPLDGRPGENLWRNLLEGAAVYLPVALAWAATAARTGRRGATPGVRLLATTAALHLGLASVGWYYRYEAWLVGWATVVAGHALLGGGRAGWVGVPRARRTAIGVLGLAAALAMGSRAADAWRYLPSRTQYTADAKVRLARALPKVAPQTVIALHDIGAMAWETDLRIVDTAALGSNRVLALHRAEAFTGPGIADVVAEEGATIGLATEAWMAHDRPPGWVPAARFVWRLDDHRKSPPIVAYALTPEAAPTARRWLAVAVLEMEGRGVLELPGEGGWQAVAPAEVQ
jgi:hypothetical protein